MSVLYQCSINRYLEMVTYTMTLLHHFIKPHFTRSFIRGQTKSTDQSASQVELSSQVKTDDEIQPINLLTVFKDVRLQRSYRSWDHSCASALGALSWASPSVDIDDYPDFDLAHIQGEYEITPPQYVEFSLLTCRHGTGFDGYVDGRSRRR